MQDVRDLLRETARRSAANEEQIAKNTRLIETNALQIAENTRLSEANFRQLEVLTREVGLLVKAVETIHGDIHKECGPGSSGRSDDWPGK